MPCHSWILDQVHSQGCHREQFCDRTRQCGVSAFAKRKTLNGLFRQWWFYLKRELYLDVFAFPHVNELKLLLCALVIEPASREEEDFVGTVLLQLKRDLEGSVFSRFSMEWILLSPLFFFLQTCFDIMSLLHFTLLARLELGGTEKVGQSPVKMTDCIWNLTKALHWMFR